MGFFLECCVSLKMESYKTPLPLSHGRFQLSPDSKLRQQGRGERAETCDAGCHLTQATKCPGHGQMDDRQRQLLSAVEGFARVKGWEVA